MLHYEVHYYTTYEVCVPKLVGVLTGSLQTTQIFPKISCWIRSLDYLLFCCCFQLSPDR